jgi:hypothetical protein
MFEALLSLDLEHGGLVATSALCAILIVSSVARISRRGLPNLEAQRGSPVAPIFYGVERLYVSLMGGLWLLLALWISFLS